MTTNRCSHDGEHTVDLSPAAHLLEELQLFGHRPFEDEPDSRPLPEPNQLHGALTDIFDALVATLNLLIDRRAVDPISGTAPHRSFMCQVEPA